MDLDRISADAFEALTGELEICGKNCTVKCVIKEVKRLPPHALRATPPFSLQLRGPSTPILPQGMVVLRHAGLEELAVFIVPNGAGSDGFNYEITFN